MSDKKVHYLPKKEINNAKKDAEYRKKAVKIVARREYMTYGLIALLVIILAGGIGVIYLNSANVQVTDSTPGILKSIIGLNNRIFPKALKPVAVVNGEQVMSAELDQRYNILPEQYKQFITKKDILSQIIDEKLLLQEATKLNVLASDSEVDERISDLLAQNQINLDELKTSLAARNLSLDDLKSFTKNELIINKLINETLANQVQVSDTDIKDYYFKNIGMFIIPESANVSHILICYNESVRCISNLTKQEALQKILDVRKLLNNINFGDIALNYSNEPAAKMTHGNLGWISVKDSFDQIFLNATFKLQKGEVSQPIETVFGYHLIKVFERKNEETLNLTSVYAQINQSLISEQEKTLFTSYLGNLRNASQIINFYNQKN